MDLLNNNEFENTDNLGLDPHLYNKTTDLKQLKIDSFLKSNTDNNSYGAKKALRYVRSVSNYSTLSNDPFILSSSVLREFFMVLLGAQIVYIITSILSNCATAAVIATTVVIHSIFCHLDARPISYWVSAALSILVTGALVTALFVEIAGLEKLRTDQILTRMTIFYCSTSLIFACLCCYLATTFGKLIYHEKNYIQNNIERIKTRDETV